MKAPRKLKKQIPKGVYCYTGIRYDSNTGDYHIKPCPKFTFIKCKDKPVEKQAEIDIEFPEEVVGWCKLIKHEIDDQCKLCGIKNRFK